MSKTKHEVIVIGHDHHNTLGVVRSLGEKGNIVKLVIYGDKKSSFTAKSKYVSETYFTTPDMLIDTLKTVKNSIEQKTAVIPCDDVSEKIIDENLNELSEYFFLPSSAGKQGNITKMINKADMFYIAEKAGLNVPKWIYITLDNDVDVVKLCENLVFPYIIKPVKIKPNALFEYKVIESITDLEDYLQFVFENYDSIIVQQYVQIVDEFGVNGCRLYNSKETVFGGVIKKKRFSQSSMGSTTAGMIMCDDFQLCENVDKLVKYVDFCGIFDVEFVFDGKDFYFVEINFRNGGYGYAYTVSGINFPDIWVKDVYKIKENASNTKTKKKTFFINESADFQNVKAGNQSLANYIFDFFKAKAHMFINIRDMKPVFSKFMHS